MSVLGAGVAKPWEVSLGVLMLGSISSDATRSCDKRGCGGMNCGGDKGNTEATRWNEGELTWLYSI